MSDDAPRFLRVFVNGVGVDVPSGGTALDAARSWNCGEAEALARGARIITDSRGLAIASDVLVSAGSIFRILPARTRGVPAASDVGGDGSEDS